MVQYMIQRNNASQPELPGAGTDSSFKALEGRTRRIGSTRGKVGLESEALETSRVTFAYPEQYRESRGVQRTAESRFTKLGKGPRSMADRNHLRPRQVLLCNTTPAPVTLTTLITDQGVLMR